MAPADAHELSVVPELVEYTRGGRRRRPQLLVARGRGRGALFGSFAKGGASGGFRQPRSPQAQKVRKLIEARGAQVLFLPSYSPALNPVEEAFSKIKAIVRKALGRALGKHYSKR